MDEGEDEDLLKAVAQEFVDRLGGAAVDELNKRAEIAEGTGDRASAETWRDIARAVESLLN
jgi:hypothetical protein